MSLSVSDVDKYPCALTGASEALNVEQRHTFTQQGSILWDNGTVMAPGVQQLSH